MDARRPLIFFAALTALMLITIASVNYALDPLCYYRCDNILQSRRTLNSYYQVLQRVGAYPKTGLVVLASSRGESLPLAWLENDYQVPALNLSVGGADLEAKAGFLRFARQKLPLRRVIWIADYFELTAEAQSEKVALTPALQQLVARYVPHTTGLVLDKLRSTLDHSMVEASLALARGKRSAYPLDQGAGSGKSMPDCEKELQTRHLQNKELLKEVSQIFDGYARQILVPPQPRQRLEQLRALIREATGAGIHFTLVIPPYHPEFARRLRTEYPHIWARHLQWVAELRAISEEGLEVRDFFSTDMFAEPAESYWTDGVHFNCRAAIRMLQRNPNR